MKTRYKNCGGPSSWNPNLMQAVIGKKIYNFCAGGLEN